MTKTKLWLCLLLALLCCTSPLHAESPAATEEMQTLRMFYRDSDLVVTPSRTPKPISQVAENISVITAKDIEEINAHTLADILNITPGIQVQIGGGPGTVATADIQGSDFRHVLVLIDGVPLNNLSDSAVDLGAIPVQHIERVEIVKGPGSSAWGSSLGGVINIITKNPVETKKAAGTAYAAIGERGSGDFRGDASGTLGSLGYYLMAGKLRSDGLTPNTPVDKDSFYAKLRWNLEDKGNASFTLGSDSGARGEGEVQPILSVRDRFANLYATGALSYALTDRVDLDLSLHGIWRDFDKFRKNLNVGIESETSTREKQYGGSAKVTWRQGINQLLVGTDIDSGELKANFIKGGEQSIDKWALFANDSIVIGRFTLIPGLRYDYTSTNGDFVSPSLGATCKISDHTIVRGDVARGFGIPPLERTFNTVVGNPNLKVEKVQSYQAGVESTVLKYLWLKATLFRHDISDVLFNQSPPASTTINQGKQRRQGVEAEIKTVPLCNTQLSVGYTFVEAKDRDSGVTIRNVPRYTIDLGLRYNDDKIINAALTGHYIWWNASPVSIGPLVIYGKYSAIIWDLNLAKKIYTQDAMALEVFFTAHNLFGDPQYLLGTAKNPGRWLEGGIRFRF